MFFNKFWFFTVTYSIFWQKELFFCSLFLQLLDLFSLFSLHFKKYNSIVLYIVQICLYVLSYRFVINKQYLTRSIIYIIKLLYLFNDTHRERLMFHSIQYRNGWLTAFDLFDMFTQSIKFYIFHYQYRCLKNLIHQIDSKNGWLLLSANFTAKYGLVLVLTLENAFS